MFIPLTTHSAYSLQEGLLLPSELVEKAKSQNLPALGLTDHRLLSGSVEFAVACQRAGIQPVSGIGDQCIREQRRSDQAFITGDELKRLVEPVPT